MEDCRCQLESAYLLFYDYRLDEDVLHKEQGERSILSMEFVKDKHEQNQNKRQSTQKII